MDTIKDIKRYLEKEQVEYFEVVLGGGIAIGRRLITIAGGTYDFDTNGNFLRFTFTKRY